MTFTDQVAWGLQIFSCFFMTGVISVIQFIHYPIFSQIERTGFTAFHSKHSNALGLIAGPLMTAELASAIWIARSNSAWLVLNVILVFSLWILTFAVSVPLHNRLSQGFDRETCHRLVKTNWPRSIIWASRSVAFIFFLITKIRFDL